MATYGYLCPTPHAHCLGSLAVLSSSLDKKHLKKHNSPDEAKRCYTRYLVGILGCERLTASEYRHPNGPIEVLTKTSRFGARLRTGKHGETGQGKSRGMPAVVTGGVIIAS